MSRPFSNLALKRNPQTGWVMGVCSGIAEYFGWSTGLVRFLFFVSLWLTTGTTLLIYIVLAVLMPRADYAPPARLGVRPVGSAAFRRREHI